MPRAASRKVLLRRHRPLRGDTTRATPDSKAAQVWNDDLVRAFTARKRDANHRQVRDQVWADAAAAVLAVQKDIYVQNGKNGPKIVNLPKGLSTTAQV